MVITFCNVVSFQKSVVNMGIEQHNKLPDSIKKIKRLKKIENAYY
jgi:hypothetical protein